MTEQEAIEEIRSCLGVNNIIMPYSDEMDAFGMAIEALEKQVPKKPYDENKDKAGFYSIYRCPCCNEQVEEEGYGDILIRFNWCNNCGKKMDWGE